MSLFKSSDYLAALIVLSATLLAAPRAGVSAEQQLCDSDSRWRGSVCIYVGNVFRVGARVQDIVHTDTPNEIDNSSFGLLHPANVSDLGGLLSEEKKYLINFNNSLTAMEHYRNGDRYQEESLKNDIAEKFQKVWSILGNLTGEVSQFIDKLQEQIPLQETPAIPVSDENATVANLDELYTDISYLARQQIRLMFSWNDTCQNCPNAEEKRRRRRSGCRRRRNKCKCKPRRRDRKNKRRNNRVSTQ